MSTKSVSSRINKSIYGVENPTKEQIIEIKKQHELRLYEKSKADKNMLSNWYSAIEPYCKTPKTTIIPLTIEQFKWYNSDRYEDNDIEASNIVIKDEAIRFMKNNNLDENQKLFIKTGNFSNKFEFKNCIVTDYNKIGKQFLDIYYSGMLMGCPPSTELVIREFIETKYNRDSIYEGMKLNTEFRIFYDFDTNELLINCNYWDKNTMLNPNNMMSDEDVETLKKELSTVENDFNELAPKLNEIAKKQLSQVKELEGQWSVDYLWDGEDFWLIDMATAESSAYYHKVLELNK